MMIQSTGRIPSDLLYNVADDLVGSLAPLMTCSVHQHLRKEAGADTIRPTSFTSTNAKNTSEGDTDK